MAVEIKKRKTSKSKSKSKSQEKEGKKALDSLLLERDKKLVNKKKSLNHNPPPLVHKVTKELVENAPPTVTVGELVENAPPTLTVGEIDNFNGNIDNNQLLKALKALVKWQISQDESKEKPPILMDLTENMNQAAVVWVQFGLFKISNKARVKPVGIPVPHSIYQNPQHIEACLIVKDPQREWKDKVQELGLKNITKVIGIKKLGEKFKPFEAKRQLCASYDLFLADDRVLEMLPKIIGKTFFLKKKQPVPLKLSGSKLEQQVKKALSSTFLHLNLGTCCSVKAGNVSMSPQSIQENVIEIINAVVEKIPGKWKNIQSISIKTPNSMALPIFAALQTETIHKDQDLQLQEINRDTYIDEQMAIFEAEYPLEH